MSCFAQVLKRNVLRSNLNTDTAYLLVSAVTTLLRFTVESGNAAKRSEVSNKLLDFLKTLRVAREHYGWDLAQQCIDTCGHPIEQLAAAGFNMPETSRNPALANESLVATRPPAALPATDLDVPEQQPGVDLPLPPDDIINLDIPWDHLWDDMVEPWRLGDFQYDSMGP